MKKKGLLILIGGRQMPNFLTAQFLKPDLIMPIVSRDETDKWGKLKPNLKPLCQGIAEPKVVNAFDLAEIKSKCYEAINENPDVKWVFNVTCATTVMSIAAYEVSKEKKMDCWYLDTNTQQVLPLIGNAPKATTLYNISINDYLMMQNREIDHSFQQKATQDTCEMVMKLGENLALADNFHQSLRNGITEKLAKQKAGIKIDEMQIPVNEQLLELWKLANSEGYIKNLQILPDDKVSFCENGFEQTRFINGDWLGMYAWLIASEAKAFDSVDYSFRIPRSDEGLYEIDFGLTFAGMLLIAECKTDKKPFKGGYLDHIVAVANQLGSNFVGKMFITNQVLVENNRGHEGFRDQAKHQQIVIIDGTRLANLVTILRKEAGVEMAKGNSPTYFRG